MAFQPPHIDRSTLLSFTVTGLPCATSIISTAIMTRLATTALLADPVFPLAISASVVEIIALVTLVAAVGLFLRRSSRGSVLLAWIPGAASCLIGTILAIIALAIVLHASNEEFDGDGTGSSSTQGLAGAGLAIHIIGLIPQTAFYVITWPQGPKGPGIQQPVETVQRSSPRSLSTRHSISFHLGSLTPAPPKFLGNHIRSEPTSPSLSAFSASPRSSLRNSASNALRPMTSRTRLLPGTSFAPVRDSRSFHSGSEVATESLRSNDEFENWDTSQVDETFDGSFHPKTRLETIPGSRPVSPAHPLNGPFTGVADTEKALPESPTLSPVASPASDTGSLKNFPRATARRTSGASMNNDQSHIHPLFRSESPVPPPMTSPGTVITASPYAGQVVTPEVALTSPRLLGPNGSRPASPNLVSPVKSRPGSMKSFRGGTAPTSPVDHDPMPDRAISQLSQLSQLSREYSPRSSSPTSPDD